MGGRLLSRKQIIAVQRQLRDWSVSSLPLKQQDLQGWPQEAATMAKESFISKTVAITFVVMTCSVIAGMITMIILYKTQIADLNPTPRPTFSTTTTGPPPVMRLPKYLVPETYTVYLQPHLYTKIIEEVNVTSPNQTLLFTGNSTVVFHCVQTTSAIYLHSKDLTIIDSSVVSLKDNVRVKINEMIHHEDVSDFLEIQLNEALEKGKNYSLFLSFEGVMSQSLDGLYLSSYHADVAAEEGDSRERWVKKNLCVKFVIVKFFEDLFVEK